MDRDRIKGAAKQAKGAVKEAAGKLTGDAKLKAEGKTGDREVFQGESKYMMRVVPIFQCFFFAAGRIEYWENIESDSDEAIQALLSQRLSAENWEAAEAWSQDQLNCRIVAPVVRPVSARGAAQTNRPLSTV